MNKFLSRGFIIKMEDTTKLIVKVNKIIFQNARSYYTVMNCRVLKISSKLDKQIPQNITVIGFPTNIRKKDIIEISGNFTADSKHGMNFKATNIKPKLPTAEQDIIKYMTTHFKGVGSKWANKIVSVLGLKTLDLIQQNPNILADKVGLPAKIVDNIGKALPSNDIYSQLSVFLDTLNINLNFATDIYDNFGVYSINRIKANPYILFQISGISFFAVDFAAKKLQASSHSMDRLKAGILNYMQYSYVNGNLATSLKEVYQQFISGEWLNKRSAWQGSLLDNKFSLADINKALQILKHEQKITFYRLNDIDHSKLENTFLYLTKAYNNETIIINAVLRRIKSGKKELTSEERWTINTVLANLSNQQNITLAPEQREAIEMTVKEQISILTGTPGTGKTATVNFLLKVLDQFSSDTSKIKSKEMIANYVEEKKIDPSKVEFSDIWLLAPTGRAAKRLSEVTHRPAKTIHKALQINPRTPDKCKYLCGKYFLVDESSMIDAQLFSLLLSHINRDSHILLIGDYHQLPSVGAGLILRDLIQSHSVPTVKLKTIFRQANDNNIINNDAAILAGRGINEDNGVVFNSRLNNDTVFISSTNAIETSKKIYQAVKTLLHHNYTLPNITLLTSQHAGILGTEQQNLYFQQIFNPRTEKDPYFLSEHGTELRIGDKVLQLKNNYDLGVMNGDLGYITDIIFREKRAIGVEVKFESYPDIKYYEDKDLADLDLGYAMTIHKSQGSETPVVIIPIDYTQRHMLDKTLIYTAASRAKEKVIFIGQENLFNERIKIMHNEQRKSLIIPRLQLNEYKKLVSIKN